MCKCFDTHSVFLWGWMLRSPTQSYSTWAVMDSSSKLSCPLFHFWLLILTCFIYLPIVTFFLLFWFLSLWSSVLSRTVRISTSLQGLLCLPSSPSCRVLIFMLFFPLTLWACKFYSLVKNLQKHNRSSSFPWSSHHSMSVEPRGLCALLVPRDGTEDLRWHLLFYQF